MKRILLFLTVGFLGAVFPLTSIDGAEPIDLKELAKKARPCVLLMIVSDQGGKQIATGSGFFVAADGKLVTNRHVVENGASAVAKAESGALFVVEGVVAVDEENDLVLLKVQGRELPFLQLGRKESIEVGGRVAVIGSPLGLEGTLSEGIVSAVRRGPSGPGKWVQITAPISAGSSGSPVLDSEGRVIGVATLLLRGGQGLNFAVTVDAVEDLMKTGSVSSGVKPLRAAFQSQNQALWADADFRAFHVAKRAGDTREALKLINSVLQRYPQSAEAHYWRGELEWSRNGLSGDLSGAEGALKRAVELKPEYLEAWDLLGLVCQLQDKLPESCAALLTAVKIRPDHAMSWLRLGHVYTEQHSYEKAIEAYQKAVSYDPKNEHAWCGLGSALEKQKRFREALAAFEQAFGLAPKKGGIFDTLEMENSLNGKAICHFYLGELKEAEACMAQMEKIDSKRAEELRALMRGK